jgi:hypothetical protein
VLGPKGGPTSSLFLKQRKGRRIKGSYPGIGAKTSQRKEGSVLASPMAEASGGGIALRAFGDPNAGLFHFVIIKPSHYDDDGYPIQWIRSAIPSNTLAKRAASGRPFRLV